MPPTGSLLRDSGDKGTEGRPDPAPPASTLQITPGGSRAPASMTTSSSGCISQTSSCGPTPCSSCVSGAVGIPACSSFSWWCVRGPPYPTYSHRLVSMHQHPRLLVASAGPVTSAELIHSIGNTTFAFVISLPNAQPRSPPLHTHLLEGGLQGEALSWANCLLLAATADIHLQVGWGSRKDAARPQMLLSGAAA